MGVARGAERAMKAWARKLLPRVAYDRLAAFWDRLRQLHPERLRRKRQHDRLQRRLPTERFALRPGLVVGLDPQSREAFEFFCFRSLEMARELDAFLAARGQYQRLLDVGALYGVFSLAFTAGRPEAGALAVDPSPQAQELLTANLTRNPGCQVRAVSLALGASAGTVTMRRDWHHLEAVGEGETGGNTLEVPTSTVDALCAELAFAPDALKIDVEGFEHQVIAGARRTLTQLKPTIFLELHPQRLRALGSSAEAVVDELRGYGYHINTVDGRALARRLAEGRVFRVMAR